MSVADDSVAAARSASENYSLCDVAYLRMDEFQRQIGCFQDFEACCSTETAASRGTSHDMGQYSYNFPEREFVSQNPVVRPAVGISARVGSGFVLAPTWFS